MITFTKRQLEERIRQIIINDKKYIDAYIRSNVDHPQKMAEKISLGLCVHEVNS